MTKKYNVSYEIVTEGSAIYGDAAERGTISESNCLRDAIEDALGGRQSVLYVDPSDSFNYRWITVHYDMDPLTGESESRDLYFNTDVSISSRKRVAKLLWDMV